MPENEVWKLIPGYENYEVSDLGRVRRVASGKILSPSKLKNDRLAYWGVNLYHNNKLKRVQVHLLVALAFIGERPEGYEVDHVDTNKLNNRPDNLEYVTHAENIHRSVLNGTSSMIKILPDEIVSKIKELLSQQTPYLTYDEIGEMTGVGRGMVSDIYHAARLRYDIPVSRERRSRLTDDDVRQIIDLINENRLQQKEIAVMFNISDTTVSRIKFGTYPHRAVRRLVS